MILEDRDAAGRLKVRPSPFDSVTSCWMTAPANSEEFAPPALTNQWAMLAAGRDFFCYEGLAAPPVYVQEREATAHIAVDGGPRRRVIDTKTPVRHRWRLDRIERRCAIEGLSLESQMALSPGDHVVLQILEVENPGPRSRRVELFFEHSAHVAATDWVADPSGFERYAATALYDEERGVWVFSSPKGDAVSVVATHPRPREVSEGASGSAGNPPGSLYEMELGPGERRRLHWVHALGTSRDQAVATAQGHLDAIEDRMADARRAWEEEWQAAFTPGNDQFSGHLPVLETSDEKLRQLYDTAIATVLYCKRTHRMGTPGFVYATGLPSTRYTFAVTSAFLWDIKMIAGLLSMLDPAVLRSMMEVWMEADIHKGYGVDFVTKRPLGFWYGVNDHALIEMAYQYVRYSGDLAWLSK